MRDLLRALLEAAVQSLITLARILLIRGGRVQEIAIEVEAAGDDVLDVSIG